MAKNIRSQLCSKFCSYYKPEKEDGLACMGFLVIERLIKRGRQIPFFTRGEKLDTETLKTLIQNMCISCPFYEDACDFIMQQEKCLPCGGFMLLGHLLETKIITIDNIRDVG